MRASSPLLLLLAVAGCDQPQASNQLQPGNGTVSAAEPENASRAAAPSAVEETPRAIPAIPATPPADPALESLSPSRRREYERGYRDCRIGEYGYDAQTQGEYYRIGCMAAENLKDGAEP